MNNLLIKKIAGVTLAILAVLNLLLFAMGKINLVYFWIGILLFIFMVKVIFSDK
jgi:hypothetical protein